ncbi:MAG: DUF4375 domain-containing protein [Candidatus Thiodiazotropha sp.]|jgi:hypothetical protein
MRFSEENLNRLLSSSNALNAVYELDSILCSASHVSTEKPLFGLSKPSYFVHLVLMYIGEVGNGGHNQYFMNPNGVYANETLEALEKIGLSEIKNVLEKAISIFPNEEIPKDFEKRKKVIESFNEETLKTLEKSTKELYKYDMKCYPRILGYLKENWADIKKDAI